MSSVSSYQSSNSAPPLDTYFVPGFGISRYIMLSHIHLFLGSQASARPYSYLGREGYLVTAPGSPLTKVSRNTTQLGNLQDSLYRGNEALIYRNRIKSMICATLANSMSNLLLSEWFPRVGFPRKCTSTSRSKLGKEDDTGSLRIVGIRPNLTGLGIVLLGLAHDTVLLIDTIRYNFSTLSRKGGEYWRSSKALKRVQVGKKRSYLIISYRNCLYCVLQLRFLYYPTFIEQDLVAMSTAEKASKIDEYYYCHEFTLQWSIHVKRR